MADKTLLRFEVMGDHKIGPDGAGKGDVVELDPTVVNIEALLAAGHIKPVDEPGAGKRPPKRS